MILVDYVKRYYADVAGTAVPPAVSGKFVLLRNGSTRYLVISPAAFTKYHADIVEKFCRDRGISGSYDSERKRFDIGDPAWNVAGGGKFELDVGKKAIKFYDNSMAYGKFDARSLADAAGMEELSGFAVQIE